MKHFDINANQGRGAWGRRPDGFATADQIAEAQSVTTFPLTGRNLLLALAIAALAFGLSFIGA